MFKDDGPEEFQNEFQAARASAHLEYSAAGRIGKDPLIKAVLDAGMFAVVSVAEVYCPYTDALLGTLEKLVAALPDEGAANHVRNRLSAGLDDDDCWHEVYKPKTSAPELPDSDNIPF